MFFKGGLFLFRVQHHGRDHEPGHPDQTGIQCPFFGQAFYLGDDDTAVIVGGLSRCQYFQIHPFHFSGNIAVFVCRCSPDDGDIDRERFVKQHVLSAEINPFHQGVFGAPVEASALLEGIDEGVQPHRSQQTWPARSNFPKHEGQHPLGQIVGLDFFINREIRHSFGPEPVSAHHPFHQAFMGESSGTALIAGPHTGDMVQGQVVGGACFQESFFNPLVDIVRFHIPAPGCHDIDRIIILDQIYCIVQGIQFFHESSLHLNVI